MVIEGNYQPSMFVVEYVNGKYGGGSVFANGALGTAAMRLPWGQRVVIYLFIQG